MKTVQHERKSTPFLSIIIVTWNAKRYAIECLQSLESQSAKTPAEIIVVDNGSTDGTPEAIGLQFPHVVLIENTTNLGFSKANNIGIALSKGKYVCLINSDVVIPPDCLDRMAQFMETHPEVGVLGPKMLSPAGGTGASVRHLPTVWNTLCCALGLNYLFPRSALLGGFSMDAYDYDTIDSVEMVSGWFWMVSREALQAVGCLDEQFFMYGEDIDWCRRFRAAGWQVVFYPDAGALHYGAASSKEAPVRFYIEMRRANLQYFRKYYGERGAFGYRIAIWTHELVRVASYSILYCLKPRRRAEAVLKIARSLACMRWLLNQVSILGNPPQKGDPAVREDI